MNTHNGANANYSTGHPLVEFFGKAGSLFDKKKANQSYYGNEATALDLFLNAWEVDKEKAFKLLLWCRDVRGGAGNRSGSRSILTWLAGVDADWINLNISKIPELGRWDDLIALVGTPCESSALELWASAINNKDGLACKWSPRENKAGRTVAKKLRKLLGFTPKEYRKWLTANTQVVETAMCNKNWNEIKFGAVPSVAMSRYGKSFRKHDETRFTQYLEDVKNPESKEKINAGALFPHDIMKALPSTGRGWSDIKYGKSDVADAQFEAMPDFFDTDMRVMPIIDTSGSMCVNVAGDTSASDVAISLAMYASDRLGEDNPFYRKFIPFSTKAQFFDWKNADGFSDGVGQFAESTGYGWIGSTNVASAFRLLLDTGSFLNVTSEQMPNTLLIISDMQFNSGTSGDGTRL